MINYGYQSLSQRGPVCYCHLNSVTALYSRGVSTDHKTGFVTEMFCSSVMDALHPNSQIMLLAANSFSLPVEIIVVIMLILPEADC
jgi:hypothetical protein